MTTAGRATDQPIAVLESRLVKRRLKLPELVGTGPYRIIPATYYWPDALAQCQTLEAPSDVIRSSDCRSSAANG